jgi:hypothetical protein
MKHWPRIIFPNEDPIGKQIIVYAMHVDKSKSVARTIVGVAGNVLYDSPDSHRIAFDGYFPYTQRSHGFILATFVALLRNISSAAPSGRVHGLELPGVETPG